VALLCPCACGAVLQMSTLPEGRPRWQVEQHPDGTLSLYPSVWRTIGCRSHFFLQHGYVIWCNDNGWGVPASRPQRPRGTLPFGLRLPALEFS
jgi:hypothetical protein